MRTRITPNTNNFYAVNVTIIGRDQLFDISWNYNIRIISIYMYTYFCIKNVININCISIDDPFLLNKKDLQGVISNI